VNTNLAIQRLVLSVVLDKTLRRPHKGSIHGLHMFIFMYYHLNIQFYILSTLLYSRGGDGYQGPLAGWLGLSIVLAIVPVSIALIITIGTALPAVRGP
jgi:uncharacterized membrane protein